MTPWWTNEQAAWIGAIGGSAIGIFGGILGTIAGICAPRGKCKSLVYALTGLGLFAGILCLTAGLCALFLKQPYAVWYPLVLGGGILTLCLVCLAPVIRLRYRQAEQRRLDAEEFRRS